MYTHTQDRDFFKKLRRNLIKEFARRSLLEQVVEGSDQKRETLVELRQTLTEQNGFRPSSFSFEEQLLIFDLQTRMLKQI